MLGALPVVDHFLARLGVAPLLDEYVPSADRRVRLAPAKAIGVVIRNLALSHQPLYSMNEWATGVDPTVLGLGADQVRLVNDDRIGRSLERLFDADRSSLLSRLVLDAVDAFGIDCTEMHNDSTSVRLTGAYPLATGGPRGGKPTAVAARGHSKDFRPDLLTELRDMFSLVRGSPVVGGWVMVLAHGHCQRRRTPGSRSTDGAVGGIGCPDWGPLRALPAA
jgi:hypothetical protein